MLSMFKSSNQKLVEAAENGDVREVSRLLARSNVDKNFKYKCGDTALIQASIKGHLDVVKVLVQAKVDVNLQNEYGDTALIWAARCSHLEVVKVLVQGGADVNLQDQDGATALVRAAEKDQLEIVKVLVLAKADVNVPDKNCNTAWNFAKTQEIKLILSAYGSLDLIAAAKNGDLVAFNSRLARRDTDVNCQNEFGNTALMCAAGEDHLEMVKMLLQAKANVNLLDRHGYTALIQAAIKGHSEIVRVLVQAKARVNLQDRFGYTALMYAARESHLELVKVLSQAQANINIQNKNGYTALIYAVFSGSYEMVKVLLQAETDINLPDMDGYTALIWAANCGNLEVVMLLLQANAAADFQTKTGWTALMKATFGGHPKIVKVLVHAKADTHLKNKDGKTAFDMAWTCEIKALLAHHEGASAVPAMAAITKAPSSEPVREQVHYPTPPASYVDLTTQVQQLLAQAAGVQARREWMQRRNALQAQYDVAEISKKFTVCAQLGKTLLAVDGESAELFLSLEDFMTLAARHTQLVDVIQALCQQKAKVKDFDTLGFLSKMLDSLRAIEADIPLTTDTGPGAKEQSMAMAEYLCGNCPIVVTRPLNVSAVRVMFRGYFEETTISSARKSATVTEVQCVIKCALRGGAAGEPLAASVAALRHEHAVYDAIQGKVRAAQVTGCVQCYSACPTYQYLVLEDHGQDINCILNHKLENGHQVVYAIAEAVQALHSLGVMHGDIKPHNMLYRYNEFGKCEVKLCDLDCAYNIGDECAAATLGTEYFHAPEVYQAARRNTSIKASLEADLFPLGLVLWQVLERSSSPALCRTTARELVGCYTEQGKVWDHLPLPARAAWSHKYLQSLTSLEPLKRMSASALLKSIQVYKASSAQQGWLLEQRRNDHLQLAVVDKLNEANAKLDKVLEVLQTKFDALGQEVLGVAATLRKEMLLGREDGQVLEGMMRATQDTLRRLAESVGDGQCATFDQIAVLLGTLQTRTQDSITTALSKQVNSAANPSAIALFDMSTQFENRFTALTADLQLFMDDQRRTHTTSATEAEDKRRQTNQLHECLTSSLRDVLSGISAIQQEVAQLQQGQQQLGYQVTVVLEQRTELAAMINTLICGTHTIPTLAIILPVVSTSWRSILSPMRLVRNQFRLFFLCSHTHRIAPCGPKGNGYKINVTKQWVQDAAPVLRVGLMLIKLALLVGGLPLPVPDLPSLIDVSGLHAKYLDAALHMVQYPADDQGSAEFDMDKAIDKLVSLEERHVLQEQGLGEGGMTLREGSRKAYETIQEVLAKDGVNIALTSGLRQVTHKGRTAWVLDNNEVEAQFRSSP